MAASSVMVLNGPFMGESNPHAKANNKPGKIATPPPPPRPPVSLIQPSPKKKQKSVKVIRTFRSIFHALPILNTPVCKFPTFPVSFPDSWSSSTRVTGTLFGYRKGRVSLSMQETPKSLPTLVMELAMQTCMLQKEMSSGMVRISLECDKRSEKDKTAILDEPMWTMYYNGKKSGYGVKREATDEDLNTMELLKAVSMGAGILPGNKDAVGPDGDLAYLRAHFERVVGSKDSETLYMVSPEGNHGLLELSIFFIRL
ncbi:hypothetical protein NE237_018740 [Protea cynaroides]|uniref:Protein MIZU-KUSSEI 1 n=1 Tax=Protea cynaroides TaxID=273540 RepID=A0A9Q0KAM7_9MAGN|nr:hypothetical protein NE237_018740 [Protea cynaroides]